MLHQQIEKDLKEALKSRDTEKAGVLRFLISAIKNFQIEKKKQAQEHLSDEEIISVLGQQAKQRKDSVSEYVKGGRADLAEKEKKELEILLAYLPEQLGEDVVKKIVEEKISQLGIFDKSGFGKLMGVLMQELKGKADGDMVKKIVEEQLAQRELKS